jgi:hypothetical protein
MGFCRERTILLEEYESPKKPYPLKKYSIGSFGTIITNLFGGSAGRGNSCANGGAVADHHGDFQTHTE